MKRGALYPAKAYHEDVDFAHICDDKQLVAVKCQWLFVHKVIGFSQCYCLLRCVCPAAFACADSFQHCAAQCVQLA